MSMLLLLPLATGLIGAFIVYIVFQIRKIIEDEQSQNSHTPNWQTLWKLIPISAGHGWEIHSVKNGVTVWRRCERSPSLHSGIFGCQALVQASSEVVITELLQPRVLALTDVSIDDVHIIPNHGSRATEKDQSTGNVDSILITEKSNILKDVMDLKSLYIKWKHKHKLKRIWNQKGNIGHSLMLLPENYLYAHKFGTCSNFVVKELEGKLGNGLSLLTLLVVPVTDDLQHINCLLKKMTCQVICLREHLDSLCLSKILKWGTLDDKIVCSNTSNLNSEQCKKSTDACTSSDADNNGCRKSDNSTLSGTEEQPVKIQHVNVAESSAPMVEAVESSELEEYADFIQGAFDLLYEVHKANGSTPGWSYQGNTKGVDVYKKSGNSECPADCYKGTTDISVPLAYALQYCVSVEYKLDWDDIYAGGAIVKEIHGLTKITHLDYKSVWPTAGRYFISLSCTRHMKDNLYGICVKGIDYPFPEVKGKVRGEILIGGFLIEEISVDPPCTRVTYVTKADLKGSVPTRLVNKVSSAQPLYMIKVREKMEERLANNDPPMSTELLELVKNYPSVYEKPASPKNLVVEATFAHEKSASSASLSTESSDISTLAKQIEDSPMSEDLLGPDTVLGPRRVMSEGNLSTSSTSTLDTLPREYSPSEFQEETSPITDFNLPRDQRGNIDFQTLGNQASATLLEEALFVSKIKLEEKQVDLVGEWVYQGTKKNIKMFRKIHEKQSIHSFLGCGDVHVVATKVWDAIKNPATRFMYDSMLKETKVLKEIGKGYRILHMRHETTACFVRQARDFVILTSERKEGDKYVLSGISVELPECPVEKDCVRATVLSSGWIIEPVLKSGRSCSQVTYLSQVNFGGLLPVRLVNHIAKRQPMSIAYLRDYLESTETK